MNRIQLDLQEINRELETATKEEFLHFLKKFRKDLENQDAEKQLSIWLDRYKSSITAKVEN